MEALSSPQLSVNRHLPTPDDCDLFLGIFNCRFGTPLPGREFRKLDGTPYQSGSEYEFHRAWEARRRGSSRPEILMYRRQQELPACRDSEQWEKLEVFFQQPPFMENGQWTGAVDRYQSPEEFARKLEGHVRRLLSQRQPGSLPIFRDWLNNQASLLTANAGPRYTSDAHVETDIGQAFDWLLVRQPAIAELDKAFSEVWKHLDRDDAFSLIRADMEWIAEALRADMYWQATPDFAFMLDTLARVEAHAWAEHEAHERGCYTGFWGPWNPDGRTELYVNIRCLRHMDGKAVIFTGAGITAGSDPQKEWEETEQKAQTWLRPIAALP